MPVAIILARCDDSPRGAPEPRKAPRAVRRLLVMSARASGGALDESDGTSVGEAGARGAVVDVSVVMPARDAAETLPRSLSALAAQETTCRWELIVVDDGSRDASCQVVEGWLPRLERARRIDNTRTPGAAGARNTGILATRGTVIAFCDADDEVSPT